MDWPTHKTALPLPEQGKINTVYAATCPTPADPMMVWSTQVDVGHLSAALLSVGETANVLLSPAHALLWAVARSLADHPHLNRRVIGRRIHQLHDVNLVIPVLDRRTQHVELVLLHKVQEMSLPQVATALWREVYENAHVGPKSGGWFPFLQKSPVGNWLRLHWIQRMVGIGFMLNGRFRLPNLGINDESNAASAVVNYFGFPGAPVMTSYKPSSLPVNACHLSVTMGQGHDQPVVENGRIVIRKMAPMSIRYDHRIGYTHQFAELITTLQRHIKQIDSVVVTPEESTATMSDKAA